MTRGPALVEIIGKGGVQNTISGRIMKGYPAAYVIVLIEEKRKRSALLGSDF